ncbi:single-stranded DNA-binding protein [Psychrobacter sp. BI730]|uniref:single-stranded DNA-binding protein n=1 Tax=Psychrobacter sp. BI730 TaxID=2705463 RepID=UPI0015CA0725|nr:single-stranded DNA-binding protein [Psychrobacter sp. BI730]NYR09566.1 single-stranded DNA-binding protein [Psychrobacter sp. BI730]
MSFNKPGRLTRDVEVRQTQSGVSVANIGIAVDHGYGDNKGTMFIDCSLWGKQAEGGLIKFLRKGRLIYVEGELGEKEYNGKKSLTLNISHIDPLFNKNESIDNEINGGGQQGYQQPSNNQQAPSNYAQQQANKAQGMQGQVNQQFAQQNQAPQNTAMAGGGMGPVDDDIPFNRFYDGQL